jgi:membrane associated rhomboid family serine protease
MRTETGAPRPRLRLRRPRFVWTPINVLVAAQFVVFVLQNLLLTAWPGAENFLQNWLQLSEDAVLQGRVWTLLTHALVHDGFWHFFSNILLLWLAGRTLAKPGLRPLLTVYLGGILSGGVLFLLLSLFTGGNTVCSGASGGVFAVLAATLFQHFHERIRLLFPPVFVPAKLVLALLAALTLAGVAFSEIPAALRFNTASPWEKPHIANADNTAHSAHLGGLLFAALLFLCERYSGKTAPAIFRRRRVVPTRQVITFTRTNPVAASNPAAPVNTAVSAFTAATPPAPPAPTASHNSPNSHPSHNPYLPSAAPAPPTASPSSNSASHLSPNGPPRLWLGTHRPPVAPARPTAPRPRTATPADRRRLMDEVNRILDKINTSGIASLSPTEHATLEHASESLKK